MKNIINIKEYTASKYLVNTLIGGLVGYAAVLLTDGVYLFLDLDVPFLLLGYEAVGDVFIRPIIVLFVFSYCIGYMHERIPHCTSPRYQAVIRFTGMIILFTLPVMLLVLTPATLLGYLYWLDLTFAFAAFPAITTVLYMYHVAKKKGGNVCSA